MAEPVSGGTGGDRQGLPRRPLMVFHAPYPLVERASASRLRPVRMRRAFEDLGFEVVEVSGYASARRRAMARAEARVEDYLRESAALTTSGRSVLPMPFVYSENATIPNALTEPRHLPLHPVLDVAFFHRMRARGLGVGVFYRDLYWRFPRFREGINPVVDRALALTYTLELAAWAREGVHLYLPSAAMAAHVPVLRSEDMSPLPPGADPESVRTPSRPGQGALNLLFVGVLGDNYRLDEALRAVRDVDGLPVSLTLCVRSETWEETREHYSPMLPKGRTEVVHASGEDLEPLYERASLGLLLVEPSEYWDFAVPYKLYEYLAHELPVVATQGTQTARLVEELGIGWVLPNEAGALSGLLRHLVAEPDDLEERRRRAREVLHTQTWCARARTVAADLSPEALKVLPGGDLQPRTEGNA